MTYKTLKTEFERELILTLILGMRKNKISDLRSKFISKAFLYVLRNSKTSDELIDGVSRLCPEYPEIIDAFLKTARKYEEESTVNNLEKVRREVGEIN